MTRERGASRGDWKCACLIVLALQTKAGQAREVE